MSTSKVELTLDDLSKVPGGVPGIHEGAYMSHARDPIFYVGVNTTITLTKFRPVENIQIGHKNKLTVGGPEENEFLLVSPDMFGLKCSGKIFDADYLFLEQWDNGRHKEWFIDGVIVIEFEVDLALTENRPGAVRLLGRYNAVPRKSQ